MGKEILEVAVLLALRFERGCAHLAVAANEAPVQRARERARWLAEWLSAALREEVPVRPMLALPRWSVEREGLSDVTVLNPRDCSRYAQGKPSLSERMQERIAFQIERACRNERSRPRRRR